VFVCAMMTERRGVGGGACRWLLCAMDVAAAPGLLHGEILLVPHSYQSIDRRNTKSVPARRSSISQVLQRAKDSQSFTGQIWACIGREATALVVESAAGLEKQKHDSQFDCFRNRAGRE